ncbi:MAG: type II toxin-antitoxin system Phd/YefM family antitoxin [Polyangiales bacterium]
MPISKFKATCLAVVERVRRTGQPVVITRFGKVVAEVVPATRRSSERAKWLGSLEGTGTMKDDLIAPASEPSAWEALDP